MVTKKKVDIDDEIAVLHSRMNELESVLKQLLEFYTQLKDNPILNVVKKGRGLI